jgi:hypothetical protein
MKYGAGTSMAGTVCIEVILESKKWFLFAVDFHAKNTKIMGRKTLHP